MCGIVGFFNFDRAPADGHILGAMLDSQRHRGPDDQGMRLFSLLRGTSLEWRDSDPPPARSFEGALGFNRLSILDLSDRGHQPMANDDGSIVLAFNGEIYNAFDYKSELEAAGYKFRSRTDTEIVLRLYEHFGLEGTLARLNGMFAIVVVDLRQRVVHLVRDHFGIKPFYWARQGSTLYFSSEVKSFQLHPDFETEIASAHIDEYLAFRYCAGDRHLIKTVNQLRPGHVLTFNEGGATRLWRYYDIPDEPVQRRLSRQDALDGVEERLQQSVKSQLLSDVKVGCQLSGGIDSSLTTLYARQHSSADMDGFSVVFDDPVYSEERWVKQAAAKADAVSHRYTFQDDDFFDILEPATWHLDQPINHPNSLGLYLLAQKSRPSVTVLLSGEGADEIFGGYPRFYHAGVRQKVVPLLSMLSRAPRIGEKVLRSLGTEAKDGIDFFVGSSMFQRPSELRRIKPDVSIEGVMAQRREIFEEGNSDYLRNCLKYDMQTYMVDLLVRQDKMTMAHSLENRVPFLDRKLVSFARSLPMRYLIGPQLAFRNDTMHNTKIVLKDLARRAFGDEFAYRPKSGFGLPLQHYYQDPRFTALMEERILPGMKQRGIIDPDPIRQCWKDISHLPRRVDEVLWVPIAFELWAQQCVDQTSQVAVKTAAVRRPAIAPTVQHDPAAVPAYASV